jgi:hypothetical protein
MPPQQPTTTRSPHGALNVPCQNCHTSNGWKPIRAVPEFDHNQTSFPLRGMHVDVNCTQCHTKPVFSNVGNKCADCHADIHKRQFGANCAQCHTVKGWQVSPQQINQHQNRFPLLGGHAALDCSACHTGAATGQFQGLSTECYSCHQKDYQQTTNPNHVASKFSTNCEQCHTFNGWADAKFDHSTTGFILSGGHAVPPRQCADCHVNNNYNLTSTACVTCHLKDYQGTTNPNHSAANFSQTCEQCHNTVSWANATFDHNTVNFPLTGGHTVPPRQCADCHANNNYNLTSTACVTCHLKDYQGTTNPNHASSNFPQTCDQCHNTTSWTNATFNHASTGFNLDGSHTVPPRQCTDCHVNNNYNLTSTACVTCHLKDYQGTTNPNHVSANYPQTCEQCHNTTSWTNATFNHASTGFALTGSHTVPPRLCTDCHVNNNYNLTSTACVTCHLKDYQGTTNPNHVSANFPQTCDQCHSTTSWDGATFNHSATGFTLVGAHTVPPRLCTDCHVNNNYNLTSTACVTCHLADYQGTTNPNHVTANFPQTCDTCHDTVAWTDSTFNHSTTGFTLTGSHTVPPRQCTDCHVNNNYSLNSTTCVTCHLKDYQGTNDPPHAQVGYSTTCDSCHNTTSWDGATFDHSTTGFTLTGAHTVPPRQCDDCHVNKNYTLNSTSCVTCHQTDYNSAKTPVDHIAAGFPTTCDTCHDTVLWTDGKFDHSTTGFVLTGSHTDPPRVCSDCHVNNNYKLTNTTCVSCHQTDYNNAKTPVDHISAGFPTTCDTCHDTVLWTDGKFDHSTTGFALAGAHADPPRTCTDCHVNNNYKLNSTLCITCHQTDYNNAKSPVDHISAGFPTTCELCHDTVLWTDATFDHNKTTFPLTGSHTVPPRVCGDCHVNNNYTTLPTACIGCHQTDYNNTTNPGHAAQPQFFPTTCQNCHSTTNWLNATFNHTQYTQFPTNHGGANNVCSTCHINSNDYSVFQCTQCHAKSDTDSNHQGVKGYVYNSVNCYQCHPSGKSG